MTSVCHFMLIIVVFSFKIYQLTSPQAIFLIALTKNFQKMLLSLVTSQVQNKERGNLI